MIQSRPPRPIAVVGCGKIGRDQHLPTIAASDAFDAVAGADPYAQCPGLPGYGDLAALLKAHPEVEAVAMCQPPAARFAAARQALLAGCHVLLEKPPASTPEEVAELARLAAERRLTLFAAWHARAAAAVAPAKAWLAGAALRRATITWKEDVRHWHPGQAWIWEPAGMGVFDPGINALSILTELVEGPITLASASLDVPANRAMPIAAELRLTSASGAPIAAAFDWRQTGPQTWDIRLDTDRGELLLSQGGSAWAVDGVAQPVADEGEYPALYNQFAALIEAGESDADAEPLRLVSEALRCGRPVATEPFED